MPAISYCTPAGPEHSPIVNEILRNSLPYIERTVAKTHGGGSEAIAISYEFIEYDTMFLRFRVLLQINLTLEELYEVTVDTSYEKFNEDSTIITPHTPIYFATS